MNGDQDVKRWLHGALTDEPPLTLNREEVFRQGRRKLRNRKLFQAGGAVTGVVAAAVGAVLLSGLVTEDPALPPAASSTEQRPPVSSSTTTTTTSPGPPSSAPVTTEGPPSASIDDPRADELTHVLLQSGLLPADVELVAQPGETGPARFQRIHGGVNRIDADVRSPKADGWLSVLVEEGGPNGGLGATCEIPVTTFEQCEVRTEHGMPMTVARQKLEYGEVRYWVRAVRTDGAFVTAISSNLSEKNRSKAAYPAGDQLPVIPQETLIAIAAHPELGTP